MNFRQKSVQCASPSGLHRMAYTEWGDPANPRVLVCVHGLTRCGRDFDALAAALADGWRVVCPDVVGRGLSDRLRDPMGYAIPQYVADMVTLIARLDAERVAWVGTSMGGLIGMALASLEGSPVSRLVLNDVGPMIAAEAVQRIADYVGQDPSWSSFDEALAYARLIHAPFGNLTDEQWRAITVPTVREDTDGRWRLRYDPRIAEPFRAGFTAQPVDLWPVYERIACPTLAVRGARSDLLSPDVWRQMGERGPKARLAEIPGVGHAPMFLAAGETAIVRGFLEGA